MLYGEKLKEILSKTGVDVSTLPDNLYSKILQAISDNIDNNTGGSTGGGSGGEITNEQALNKLLPPLAYNELDWGENVNEYISAGMISSASDIKLYKLYDQNAESTTTITAGSIFLKKMNVNISTNATSLSLYSLRASHNKTEYGTLETTSVDMGIGDSNMFIMHIICIAVTDITSNSGKYIELCALNYFG